MIHHLNHKYKGMLGQTILINSLLQKKQLIRMHQKTILLIKMSLENLTIIKNENYIKYKKNQYKINHFLVMN